MKYRVRKQWGWRSPGFALPAVLISSIIMLSVLVVAAQSTAATRVTLQAQIYNRQARLAAESGVAYAKSCLAANNGVPQWTDAKPLTPNTDCTGTPIPSFSPQVLVIAGGGGGANSGAGGGAGGYVYGTSVALGVNSYPITVGAGGAGGPPGNPSDGGQGGNSVFASITAIGGGGGRSHWDGTQPGLNGGSGGGGNITTSGAIPPGGIGSQGNNGGAGYVDSGWVGDSGGGGGAGSVGAAGGNYVGAGRGGAGLANSITGTSVFYAGGGGGGEVWGNYAGAGGVGGGGNALVNNQGYSASANSGGGGGGGSYGGAGYNPGGNGGSGIVIISYPTGIITATGGTITTSGGNTIHTFTTSGTFTVTQANPTTCPGNVRCSVSINNGARSRFSVPKPKLDSSNLVVSISATGYTDLVRTSNLAVWRTYQSSISQSTLAAPGVNLAPDFTKWTLSGGAYYDTASRQLTLPASGMAVSPLIRVDRPWMVYMGGDFYATTQAAYAGFEPKGGYHITTQYFAGDGVTSATSSAGYTTNGCAQPIDLNVWTVNDTRCGFLIGNNIVFLRYNLYGSSYGYASPGVIIRNPQVRVRIAR